MALTNAYCSLADVKNALRITDTLDDLMIEASINAASRMIDQYCNRYFYSGSAGEVRKYTPVDSYYCWIDDVQSITELKTSSTLLNLYDVTWDVTDYEVVPKNRIENGGYYPITKIRAIGHYLFPIFGDNALVQVTGTFGWPAIPDQIKFATILQASRLFKRLESPLGVAGVSDMGIMRVGSSVDGDVAQLINPYRLLRTGA